MKPRLLDIAAIVLSIAVVAAFSVHAYTGRGLGGQVTVEAAGGEFIYSLDQDRVVRVPGPLGDTILVIRGGAAWVEDSPCPDKICVAMGGISRPGEWIACLPNRVMVSVGGRGEAAVDGTAF
jgi:hypothetical protein